MYLAAEGSKMVVEEILNICHMSLTETSPFGNSDGFYSHAFKD